jgi:hypothetical protein
VHAFGVTGQVVSATTQEALSDASVIAMDQPDHPAHCDEAGRFRLQPKRGWQGAYCISDQGHAERHLSGFCRLAGSWAWG